MKTLTSLVSLSHLSPALPITLPDIPPEEREKFLKNITSQQELIDEQEKSTVSC